MWTKYFCPFLKVFLYPFVQVFSLYYFPHCVRKYFNQPFKYFSMEILFLLKWSEKVDTNSIRFMNWAIWVGQTSPISFDCTILMNSLMNFIAFQLIEFFMKDKFCEKTVLHCFSTVKYLHLKNCLLRYHDVKIVWFLIWKWKKKTSKLREDFLSFQIVLLESREKVYAPSG